MSQQPDHCGEETGLLRFFGIRRDELPTVAWSAAHFFFLLSGYYIIHPIRDAMGLTGGIADLQRLFLITLGVMLAANPFFAAFVSCYPRRVFVPAVYVFFAANLLIFFFLFRSLHPRQDIALARVFFVWASVFNLFIVSVFWAMMADVFTVEQGKRLFGLVAAGGTLGAIAGAAGTAILAPICGETSLLAVSAVLLGMAGFCAVRSGPRQPAGVRPGPDRNGDRIGGSPFAGITHAVRSPFLAGICLYIFCTGFGTTLSYFAQGTIVEQSLSDREGQAALFASMDLLVNLLAAVIQIFLTARVIRWLGVGWTLAILPLVFMGGFAGLTLAPTLSALFAVQVIHRAVTFGLAWPARESLFTILPREDKYKAKNFVDTFVFRVGDAVGAGSFALLTSTAVGLDLRSVLLLAWPALIVWLAAGLFLGRSHAAFSRRYPAAP